MADIFPFVPNKALPSERDQEHYLSEPYSGNPKALVRGSFKRAYSLVFTTRTQAEFDAAETFHASHYPLTIIIFRNYRFYPTRDFSVRITSPFREQGSETSGRFNYSFDVVEI